MTDGDPVTNNDTLSFPYSIVDNNEPWVSVDRPLLGSGDPRFNEDYRSLFTGDFTRDNEEIWGYDYAVAYPFYIPKGLGNYLNTIRFGVNHKASNSGDIKIYLYEWNPREGHSFLDNRDAGAYVIPPSDRVLKGCMGINWYGGKVNSQPMNATILLQPDHTDMKLAMATADPLTGQPILNDENQPIPLELNDNQMYALVIVFNPSEDAHLEMLAAASPIGSQYDLSGYNLAMDKLGKPYRAGSSLALLANGGDFETELSGLTFINYNLPNSPWIEMEISDDPSFEGISSSKENLSESIINRIDIFPNPAKDKLNISVSLSELSHEVSFELINTNGEIVKRMEKSKVKRSTYCMAVNKLPAGVYTLRVRAEEGFTTKKVILTN